MSSVSARKQKLVKEGAISGKYEHDVDTYYAESQRGLAAVVEVRDAFYDNAEQVLSSAYSAARASFVIASAASSRSSSRASACDDGPSPCLQADRRPDCRDVASRRRRCLRRNFQAATARRDRRDGGGRPGLQGQHDQGGSPGRGEGSGERHQDAARPRAR